MTLRSTLAARVCSTSSVPFRYRIGAELAPYSTLTAKVGSVPRKGISMNTIFDPTDLVFVNPLIQMADGGARINFDGKWKVVPVNNGLTFVKVEKQADAPALVDEDDDDSYW